MYKNLISVAVLSGLLLLGGCSSVIVRNDKVVVDSRAEDMAKLKIQELIGFHEVSRNLSSAALGLCQYKFPKLDFVAQALPSNEFIEETEAQALMRVSKIDSFPRVLHSWNPAIKVGARIERVGNTAIAESPAGDAFQKALIAEALDADSLSVVIDGVTHTYKGKQSCATTIYYGLPRKIRDMRTSDSSDRFIARLAATGRASENEKALAVATYISQGAGGNLDNAVIARNILRATSVIPFVPFVLSVVGGPIVNATIDQDKVDSLSIEILRAGGYNPSEIAREMQAGCKAKCEKLWPEQRRIRWEASAQRPDLTADKRSPVL